MFYVVARQSVSNICVRDCIQTLLEGEQGVLGPYLRSEVPPVSRAQKKNRRGEKTAGDHKPAKLRKRDEKGTEKEEITRTTP